MCSVTNKDCNKTTLGERERERERESDIAEKVQIHLTKQSSTGNRYAKRNTTQQSKISV